MTTRGATAKRAKARAHLRGAEVYTPAAHLRYAEAYAPTARLRNRHALPTAPPYSTPRSTPRRLYAEGVGKADAIDDNNAAPM